MRPWQGALLLASGLTLGALGMRLATPWLAGDGDDHPAAAPASAVGGGLHVDATVQRQAGLRLTPLTLASLPAASEGFARALDLSPLAAIAAEITAATAAHDASAREAARLAGLVAADAGAARRDLDAARGQEGQDAARLTLACQRPALEFGAGLARLGCATIPGLAREAAQGRLAVLRLDFPDGPVSQGASVAVDLAPAHITVRTLGPAITGDTQLQSAGALALVRGEAASAAGVGRVLAAHRATGEHRAGLVIPREAIVRADGTQQVYRALGGDGFERVSIDAAQPVVQGWFLPLGHGLRPGDRLVVAGAGTLLGIERSASGGQSGDD